MRSIRVLLGVWGLVLCVGCPSGEAGDDDAAIGDDDVSDDDDAYWGDDDDGWDGDDDLAGDDDDAWPGDDDDAAGDDDHHPGQLTAGEWRDLDHWEFWRGLLDDQASDWYAADQVWDYDTAERVRVEVVDGADPAVDARVALLDEAEQEIWVARTDVRGRADLFAAPFGGSWTELSIRVDTGDAYTVVCSVEPTWVEPIVVGLSAPPPPAPVDLMFAVDTTGSMSDELEYLAAELEDVLLRAADGQNLEWRYSVNFYRDHGDTYVVRSFPFTTDLGQVVDQLSDQSADGGGDLPEAVDEALQDAVEDHQWSASARARLLFLVLDAPPHRDGDVTGRLHEATEEAASRGIRIIPVVASGMNKDGEFLLRSIDVLTGATYTFLTDHSGIGNSHLEPTIGEYEVEYLNELLLRLISEAVTVP